MSLKRAFILLVIVLVAGCSRDRGRDATAEQREPSLPGVYSGVFPCDGCPGIASTLWLRADGLFFFRQQYPAEDAREEMNVYSLGRWNPGVDELAIELEGSGPKRTLTHPDIDTLVMQTDSELEHRLTRDYANPDFSATIRMVGMMRLRGQSASFTECSTGLVAPVVQGGDFARFRHQYRSAVVAGEPAYVELEGRFSWSDAGTLESMTIERFVTIRSNGSC